MHITLEKLKNMQEITLLQINTIANLDKHTIKRLSNRQNSVKTRRKQR